MPRKTYTRAKKPAPKKIPVSKLVKDEIKKEIKAEDKRSHPVDAFTAIFDGGNVNTTPDLKSFQEMVSFYIEDNELYKDMPETTNRLNEDIKLCKIYLETVEYQLRYQQDAENIESSNTFRCYFYSYKYSYNEDPGAIAQGTDIDHPLERLNMGKLYMRKMATLRPGSTGNDYEGSVGVSPGTINYYGFIKIGKFINMEYNENTKAWTSTSPDYRFEQQSDTGGDGLQLYGYLRYVFRLYD